MLRTAIILAAGCGTKIWPYCDTWPKAALPIANKSLIRRQVEILKACGIERFVVVVGHLASQVKETLIGLESVSFVEQYKPSGTADALLLALKTCDVEHAFFVMQGDILFAEEDCRRLMEKYSIDQNPATLVQPLGSMSPNEWICANLEGESIKEILGHPREATHRLCGLSILPKEIIPFLETNPGMMTSIEVGNMPPQESELAESLSRYLQKGNSLSAIETQHLFFDIDKPWHLLEANTAYLNYLGSRLTNNHIASNAVVAVGDEIEGYLVIGEGSYIGKDVKIKGNLWVGKNTNIVDGAIIGKNTRIGDNCTIREYCKIEECSAIGNRCVIGHAAEFGGILMDGAYSFHYGEYWGIIGRSTDLGAATVCGNLRFDDQNTIHRIKGRRELPASASANAAYLGDFTRTGVNTILMPGVKIGPYSVIGAGVILNEDVPNNSLIYVKQELIRKKWGPEQYGW